jgi:thiol:disulfide interchange protein DsbA
MRFLLAVMLAAACSLAQAQPTSGRDYQELNPPRPVSSGERIEVIEFFYYGCPVCYESQPHIARWLMRAGPGIVMVRADNHHFDGKQLNEEKNVVDWVSGNGVDGARFKELWHSDEVKAQIDAAKKALETYDVKGVPTFVIDGKYITSARMAGSVPGMMRVVEFLVARAAGERKKL